MSMRRPLILLCLLACQELADAMAPKSERVTKRLMRREKKAKLHNATIAEIATTAEIATKAETSNCGTGVTCATSEDCRTAFPADSITRICIKQPDANNEPAASGCCKLALKSGTTFWITNDASGSKTFLAKCGSGSCGNEVMARSEGSGGEVGEWIITKKCVSDCSELIEDGDEVYIKEKSDATSSDHQYLTALSVALPPVSACSGKIGVATTGTTGSTGCHYGFGEKGGAGCPAGYHRITQATHCSDAATALPGAPDYNSVTYDVWCGTRPNGCFMHKDLVVHYNPCTGSNTANSEDTPICKKGCTEDLDDDYQGNDVATKTGMADEKVCASHCDSLGAPYFTFGKTAHIGNCWCKSAKSGEQAYTGIISGQSCQQASTSSSSVGPSTGAKGTWVIRKKSGSSGPVLGNEEVWIENKESEEYLASTHGSQDCGTAPTACDNGAAAIFLASDKSANTAVWKINIKFPITS